MRRLRVDEVDADGLAALAGVQAGDYLDSYNGAPLPDVETLLYEIEHAPGDENGLRIIREEAFLDLICPQGRLSLTLSEVELDPDAYQRVLYSASTREEREQARRLAAITLTTTPQLEGYRCEVIEIISAECVYGMHIFRDLAAAITDVVGGRSRSVQKVLRDARQTCLEELRMEALKLEADAVVGVDLDYSELSGGGKSMLFLVASGTAVRTTPLEPGEGARGRR